MSLCVTFQWRSRLLLNSSSAELHRKYVHYVPKRAYLPWIMILYISKWIIPLCTMGSKRLHVILKCRLNSEKRLPTVNIQGFPVILANVGSSVGHSFTGVCNTNPCIMDAFIYMYGSFDNKYIEFFIIFKCVR